MNKELFLEELKKISIVISKDSLSLFEKYKNLLQEYNKKFNLTSIITDDEIYLKHFYDSLFLMTTKEFKASKIILDIGVGAGFPSIPLAILNNEKEFTLVESNGKKTNFLNKVKEELNLKNITIVNTRAEDFVKENREKYDLATSRAVAHLKVLSELEIPSLKVNGFFMPMKSSIEEEIKESEKILNTLESKIEEKLNYTLPIENSKRTILIIRKNNITNQKYPREYNKIINELKRKNNRSN